MMRIYKMKKNKKIEELKNKIDDVYNYVCELWYKIEVENDTSEDTAEALETEEGHLQQLEEDLEDL